MGRVRIIASAALPIGLLILFTWPVWRWLWGEWWSNPYYSHGLLVLPVAFYLAWRRLRSDQTAPSFSGDSRGLILLLIGASAFVVFINFRALYLASFAAITIAAALTWSYLGLAALKRILFPLAFLALAVPLPFVERSTLPLALWTGSCSTSLASWMGLELVAKGNAVSLPNAELVIGAQCSGMNSLIALTSLTSLVAYVVVGPLWGRISLLFLAIPLAVLGNILRVTNLIFVARYWGAEQAFHYYHDLSGPIFFLIVLVLLYPLSRMLQCRQLRFERF